MGVFIDQWIRDGDLAGYWDGRFGHWNDRGNNGNNGIMSTGCIWEGFALRFPANTDEVTIADAVTLRLIAGAITAALDVRSMTATEYVVAHDNAGSGYSLGINAGGLVFTGNGVARTLAVSLHGVKSIGVTFTHGGAPIGYVNGLSVGNFSGAVNITAAAVATEIGNWANSGRCKSPIGAVLLGNRIFTSTEMADAHVELVGMSYPTKLVSAAKRTQAVNRNEPGLVAGWDMRPAGGVIPDQVGGNDGTIVGCPMYAPGILGDAMRFDGSKDYVEVDSTPIITTAGTLEIWSRSYADDANYLFASDAFGGGNFYIRRRGTSRYRYVAGTLTADAAATPLNLCDHHIITWDATNAYAYLNGALVGSGAHGGGAASTAANMAALFNDTAFHDCSIVTCRVLDNLISPAEVSAKYLEGARAIQWKTDWGFQVSPAAEGGVLHQQIGTRNSPFRARDTTFRGVIETDTVNGRLNKVLRCTVVGVIYIPTNQFFDCTPTEAAFGTWGWWYYAVTGGLSSIAFVANSLPYSFTGYFMELEADGTIEVLEAGAGPHFRTVAGACPLDAWNSFGVTRSSPGKTTSYINSAVITANTGSNPFTDATMTTSAYWLVQMAAGDKIALGNVQGGDGIVKRLGVFPP